MSLDEYLDKLNKHRGSSDRYACRFGGGAGSGGSTSTSAPWTGQQGYLSNTFQLAQNLQDTYTPQYFGYTGTAGSVPTQTGQSAVSPLNSQETGALGQINSLGMNGDSQLGTAGNAINQYASGSMLGANNPYFQSTANQIQSSMLPGLMNSFTQGSTDNPNVAFAASQGLGNAIGNVAEQNYETQSQNQLNAAGMAPNYFNTQLTGANAALSAGQTQQQQAQNELNNQVNAFNYYQQLPYTQLNNYANLVQGQYGQATTNTAPAQGLFSEIFGGNPSIGTSDRRLKRDIKEIGRAHNGLPIYIYKFKDDIKGLLNIGFMADEVEKLHPEAVIETSFGKAVDYEKAVL